MVEIYNETVVDLLAEGGKREVELAKCAGGFAVPDLTRVGARSPLQPTSCTLQLLRESCTLPSTLQTPERGYLDHFAAA